MFDEAVALTAPARTFTAALAGLLEAARRPRTRPTPRCRPSRFAPRFDTPMARSLAELGQHWLLPGLDGVPADTALGLRTNGAFVEAFMLGLNHEFGRELLWREFPTPLTATFFDRFWDAAVAPEAPPDVAPLADWADRALGAPTVVEERFVLLLRSELIRRFPDAAGHRRPRRARRPSAAAGVPRLAGPRRQLLRFRHPAGRRRRLVDRDRRAARRPALRLRGRRGAGRRQPRARHRCDRPPRRPRGCASCPPGSPSRSPC